MRSLSVVFVLLLAAAAQAQAASNPCPSAQPVPPQLHLPADLQAGEPVKFEQALLKYVSTLDYRNLGWCHDKSVRDTGPLILGTAATVHPAVHVYYSPEVSEWLLNGRHGEIPDGAVIIKEQFSPIPAARYSGIAEKDLGCSNDWTIMIRDSKGSLDGWFWAEVWNGSSPTNSMNFKNPFQYPNAGFGLVCVRCHASTENEITFASLKNIDGGDGFPLQYRIDDSWRSIKGNVPAKACGHGKTLIDYIQSVEVPAARLAGVLHEEAIEPSVFPNHEQNAAIETNLKADHFAALLVPPNIQRMPPEPLDTAVAKPKALPGTPTGKSPDFVTSSQCLGCHGGLTGAGLGPTMVIASKTSPTINVSPYGEWRWSPMGLAGRDPVFYSQLDSELAFLKQPAQKQGVINTCMTCHGAMGKRTFAADHPDRDFKVDFVYDTDQHSEGFKYGGLARDGISCEVCHRMAPPKDPSPDYFFAHQINGVYDLVPDHDLNGPFKDDVLTTYPMVASLNVKPKFNPFIQSPQMCGTCHTILLPVLDSPIPDKTSVEQATYPEWLNSDFRDEYGSQGPAAETCQECHMPAGYVNDRTHVEVASIKDKIATIQDLTYPAAEHLAKPEDIDVRFRQDGYRRHELLGQNGFLLQMFEKPINEEGNNEVLGVRLSDYMTGLKTDLQAASNNVVQQAKSITATVEISKWEVTGSTLVVEVTVTNKAGHRFPSGVGFRRAFLDLEATVDGKPIFSSGATNSMGQIVNSAGQVLPTESFKDGAYQPHFDQEHPVKSSDQVQIYEELIKNADNQFTTSFTRRDHDIKDNRLLPRGWKIDGPADLKIPEPYLHATLPVGDALKDPVYLAGKGQSIVRYEIPLPAGASAVNVKATVSLYSQTMPPYFLADRAETKTPATARLEYLAHSLGTLEKTEYANWKLLIASASK